MVTGSDPRAFRALNSLKGGHMRRTLFKTHLPPSFRIYSSHGQHNWDTVTVLRSSHTRGKRKVHNRSFLTLPPHIESVSYPPIGNAKCISWKKQPMECQARSRPILQTITLPRSPTSLKLQLAPALGFSILLACLRSSPGCRGLTVTLRIPSPKLIFYACDINTAFFPDAEITEAFGITTFQQDVTKPFPQDLYGKFDLIHVSLLAVCLTVSSWESALDNYRRLLS